MTDTKKGTKKITFAPNIERVICKVVNVSSTLRTSQNNLLVPGQLKAGENLLAAEVIHPGATKFKQGQLIYYSEYSASVLVDVASIIRAKAGYAGLKDDKYQYIVIAEDDIMAYEEYDPDLKLDTSTNDKEVAQAWSKSPVIELAGK